MINKIPDVFGYVGDFSYLYIIIKTNTMLKSEALEQIHKSFVNGQNKQGVELIDGNCTMYDFWEDYKNYLEENFLTDDAKHHHFSRVVIAYHRIKNR